jgi:intein/homing endonuclease
MDYWELRRAVSKIVPGMSKLDLIQKMHDAVREKGRKKNYHQYNLVHSEWRKQERLLNTEEINSFLEISIRAQACPMPFNMDIWDGLLCIAEGERVKTHRGDIPIEEVIPGDIVLTYNEKTKQLEWNAVSQVSRTVRKNLVEVETEIGTIKLTEDHRVFTQRGWLPAGELTNEDVLYTDEISSMHLKPVKVKHIRKIPQKTSVYDLTIEGNSNFFAERILVHNCPYACIYCFPSGTKVLMVDGSEKVIERVRKGDRIISFNETTHEIENAEVTATMKRVITHDQLIGIELETGETLQMTAEHPVYIQGKGWVAAQDIQEEDEVLVW